MGPLQNTSSVSTENLSSKAKKVLYKRVHILQWLPKYTKKDVLADFISGLTVGLTMMPQSIAYAGLAGMAPQYGLYTAFIGSFTYVFFGTVKEVSIGPTSLMSILSFSYTVGKPVEYVILLAFIAGVVELLMGILKCGFLVDFISPCLTSGFTSATTLIITMAQLKALFGLKIKSHDCIGIIKEFFQKFHDIKLADTIVSISCFVFLIAFKQLPKLKVKNPSVKKLLWFLGISKNALIVLITSMVAFYMETNGGVPFSITGNVPKGLPDFSFPSRPKIGNETVGYKEMIDSLGSGVIVVPVVAVLANVAIAKAYSGEVIIDASQEMISLGLCNILGSFVKAMPSCGAFTRSAVASSSDVRSPLQGIYSGSVIILALSFLAPYFRYIPKSTLAAVLITAASSLLDYQIFPVLWRTNKMDFFLTLLTFILGSLFGVEMALIIGCVCNLTVLLKVWFRPKILAETRIKGVNGESRQYLYIKPELGLYYPGADYVSEYIKKMSKQIPKLPIIIDCCNIIRIDYAAAKTLEILLKTYNENKRSLVMINLSLEILETMRTVTDTEYLELCFSSDTVPEIIVDVEEREALLNGSKTEMTKPSLVDRRKSSTRSGGSRKQSTHRSEERKLSIYDFE
ncbi:sodium-independent sulfate anion transporter [Leptinotarsa decemlineata]|uniref:sodium-independent sulfate anion transporter n=1 Tax=Leptinotarsa decemlineata TaxID=7539 RepID=UPI003D30A839